MYSKICFLAGAALSLVYSVHAAALPADVIARVENVNVTELLAARQEDKSYGGTAVNWDASTCSGPGGHMAYLTFASCSSCTLSTDPNAGPNCGIMKYISAHDTPTNFGNDFCNKYILINDNFNGCDANVDTFSINTPNGFGKFVSNGNCNNVPSNSVSGTIITKDGLKMVCSYMNINDHKWTSFCGPSSSQCNAFLQCAGQHNPSICTS